MPVTPVLIKPYRALDGMVADATVEENHEDDSLLTDQPVEVGSVITDNMVNLPAVVTLTLVWGISGKANANLDPNFLQEQYQNLLAIKTFAVVFALYTGKRVYNNMVLKSINVVTEKPTEYVLAVRCVCREIQFAVATSLSLSNPDTLSNPQGAQSVINTGPAQLVPSSFTPPS